MACRNAISAAGQSHSTHVLTNAEAYWTVLSGTVIPGIEAKSIQGFRGVEVLRHDHADEVEFVTIMTFDSLQSVIDFQGEDYARAYVPDVAQAVLSRWDTRCAHYEILGKWPQ